MPGALVMTQDKLVQMTKDWAKTLRISNTVVNKMLKRSWFARGLYWHKTYRERHFQPQAMSRYNYTPRKKSYNIRKQKYLKQTVPTPLVYKGESKLASRTATIHASQNQVRVSMPTPKLNYRPAKGTIRMADELRTVRDDENEVMDKLQAKQLAEKFERYLNYKDG